MADWLTEWLSIASLFFKVRIGYQHTCLPLLFYCICAWKSWKSIGRSGNTNSLSKFWILSCMKTKEKNKQGLSVSSESSQSVCTRTFRNRLLRRWACAKDRNMQVCSWKSSACARKTRSRRGFPKVSWGEHHIHEASSQIALQNQGNIYKNVSYMKESMAVSSENETSPNVWESIP